MSQIVTEFIPNELYSKLMYFVPILCVDVMPFRNNWSEILLGLRTNEPLKGEYFATGGRLLKNEGTLSGAVRQAKRELGLDLNSESLIEGGYVNEVWQNSAFHGVNYHTFTVFYGFDFDALGIQEIQADAQHDEFKWFNVNDSNIHPLMKERIQNVLSKLGLSLTK